MKNPTSLDSICAALAYAMGMEAPACAAEPNADLCAYLDKKLDGKKADRIFMYNPDAVAQWVYEKYAHIFAQVKNRTDIEVPLRSVFPPVTPVCFGTMYTGAQPKIHGIQAYVKPIITIDTIFDALIRNGKKPAIVSTSGDSMSKIFLGRDMDYFVYDTVEQVNAKAAELIVCDEHDFIAVYNGNYDSFMHKRGPESERALGELGSNVRTFEMFYEMIVRYWNLHNTLIGFASDHGCHKTVFKRGSHGRNTEPDLNIVHLYKLV